LGVRTENVIGGEQGEPNGYDQVNVRVLEGAVEALREQLGVANRQINDERGRADRAEQRADDERKRADDERARADRERDRADQADRRVSELMTEQRAQQESHQRRRWWWQRRSVR
jgi:hypothetical protein